MNVNKINTYILCKYESSGIVISESVIQEFIKYKRLPESEESSFLFAKCRLNQKNQVILFVKFRMNPNVGHNKGERPRLRHLSAVVTAKKL